MVTRSIGTAADGFSALQASDVALDPVDQGLVGRAEVGAAGVRRVVGHRDRLGRVGRIGRGRRRRPAMEVAVAGEGLADQLGADDLAVLLDEAAVGLVREEQPGRCR